MAEGALLGAQARRETALWQMTKDVERAYDAVLIDSAPSISILQSCAMLSQSRCSCQSIWIPYR